MIATIAPILQDDVVVLKPFAGNEDKEYLVDLSMKYRYTTLTREDARKTVDQIDGLFWTAYIKQGDIRAGITFLAYWQMHDLWTLDGYRDDPLVRTLIRHDYSYHAARLVIDWALENVTTKLSTFHDTRNRAATLLCRRLGFKVAHKEIDTPSGKMIALTKEREYGN